MGLKVKIHFTGLCAFVPDKDVKVEENEAAVILVNARCSPHEAHHALLFADAKDVYPMPTPDQPRRKPHLSFMFRETKLDDPFAVNGCLLGGEVLTLVGRTQQLPRVELKRDRLKFATGDHDPDNPCPTNEEEDQRLISWVAQNPGTLNPEVCSTMERSDLIAVRMKLTEGDLFCGGFRMVPRGVVRWKFGEGQSTALAEEVVYEHEFADDSGVVGINLESEPFRDQLPHDDLFLHGKDDVVEVWIVNMPLASVLEADPERPMDPDHHFHEFYRLCIGTIPTIIPEPDLNSFCPRFQAASNPKCPPTLFAAPTSLAAPEQLETEDPLSVGHSH
jgi:hypothetical protein